MDPVKLEKRLRLVPFACVLLIIVLRKFLGDENSFFVLIATIFLALISIVSFFYIMHLEKKDGRFNPRKYYVFYFFIIISVLIFAYKFMKI